ncbi:MAG: MOSC domain-containing protein [Alphaproteobacteria bacterium]
MTGGIQDEQNGADAADRKADTCVITALYRYPVKGFSADTIDRASVSAGGIIPHDRQFAIENGPSGFDDDAPAHLSKAKFLVLMRNALLAEYETDFDPATGQFTIRRDGAIQVSDSLYEDEGRAAIEYWSALAFSGILNGAPKIRFADGHTFSDVGEKCLHLINLASLRDLESRLGEPINPARFRANIIIDGAPPYAELDWIGRSIHLPDINLQASSRTSRCNATNVDPATGVINRQIPRTLMGYFGHMDFGIYLSATTDGELRVGDRFQV